jgi:hypothetical protein
MQASGQPQAFTLPVPDARRTRRRQLVLDLPRFEVAKVENDLVPGPLGGTPLRWYRLALRESPFDWDDRATWAPALRNIQSEYLTYYPDLVYTPPPAGAMLRQWCGLGAEELAGLVGRWPLTGVREA